MNILEHIKPLLAIIFVALGIADVVFVYLIIVGGNMNKTDEERRTEDEEQMKYLKKYKNKNKWR